MKVIEEAADVQDGVARQIKYHLPRSTRKVERLEDTGLEQAAYCGYSKNQKHLGEEDFMEYDSVTDLPEGESICSECVTELSNQGTENPYQMIFQGELDDPRVVKEDQDESD